MFSWNFSQWKSVAAPGCSCFAKTFPPGAFPIPLHGSPLCHLLGLKTLESSLIFTSSHISTISKLCLLLLSGPSTQWTVYLSPWPPPPSDAIVISFLDHWSSLLILLPASTLDPLHFILNKTVRASLLKYVWSWHPSDRTPKGIQLWHLPWALSIPAYLCLLCKPQVFSLPWQKN